MLVDVRQRDIANLDIVIPLVEELDVADLLDNILGEHLREGRVLDLDISFFGRHIGGCAVVPLSLLNCGLVCEERWERRFRRLEMGEILVVKLNRLTVGWLGRGS